MLDSIGAFRPAGKATAQASKPKGARGGSAGQYPGRELQVRLSLLRHERRDAPTEVVESEATMLVPDTNVGGYINTGLDLIANPVGVVAAAVLIRLKI